MSEEAYQTSQDGTAVSSVGSDALRERVQQFFARSRQAFPEIEIDFEVFFQRIAAIIDKQARLEGSVSANDPKAASEDFAEQALDRLRWEELYLTTACAEGNETAWSTFQARYQSCIQKAARACAENATTALELAESLMTDLYLPPRSSSQPRTPRIGQYHGLGSLEGWLKVVVARMSIDHLRSSQKQVSLDEMEVDLPDLAPGCQTASLVEDREQSVAFTAFSEALAQALEKLSAQERLVLKLHYLQAVNLKDLAKLLGAHESTASRLLERIRRQLRKTVEKHLRDRLRLNSRQVQQVIEAACSQTEIDFRGLLTK